MHELEGRLAEATHTNEALRVQVRAESEAEAAQRLAEAEEHVHALELQLAEQQSQSKLREREAQRARARKFRQYKAVAGYRRLSMYVPDEAYNACKAAVADVIARWEANESASVTHNGKSNAKRARKGVSSATN